MIYIRTWSHTLNNVRFLESISATSFGVVTELNSELILKIVPKFDSGISRCGWRRLGGCLLVSASPLWGERETEGGDHVSD